MSTARIFGYNPNRYIVDGANSYGNVLAASATTMGLVQNVVWYNGPDENLGYIICDTNSGIVQKGIVLNLDVSNINSYNGSGRFYDLSSNYENIGSINGADYDTSNMGNLVFRSIFNSYIDMPLNDDLILSDYGTIQMWFKIEDLSPGLGNTLIMKGKGPEWQHLHYILFQIDESNKIYFSTSDGVTSMESGGVSTPSLQIDTWYNVAVVWDSNNYHIMYLNGLEINRIDGGLKPPANGIGECVLYLGATAGYNFPLNGREASIQIYNRALSASEILQNFNATKFKFDFGQIVTDGLVLNLDATNINSFPTYPTTGTTWYDISGNGHHFTLDSVNITYDGSKYYGNFNLDGGGLINNDMNWSLSTTCTCVFWILTTDETSLFLGSELGNGYYLGAYSPTNKEYYGSCGSPIFYMDTVDTPNIYDYIRDGGWHMLEFKNVNLSTWNKLRFNKYSGYTFSGSRLSNIMIYNRNLTTEESLQNYNTLKYIKYEI